MIPLKYWLFLAFSIVLEVTGTSLMKISQNNWPLIGLGLMYIMLALSYFFLARAVIRLPLGVAYAIWEGFGLALITLSSILLIGEELTPTRLLALCMVLGGSILVHRGTGHGPAEKAGRNTRVTPQNAHRA